MNYEKQFKRNVNKLERQVKKYTDMEFSIDSMKLSFVDAETIELEVSVSYHDEINDEWVKEIFTYYGSKRICGAYVAGYLEKSYSQR